MSSSVQKLVAVVMRELDSRPVGAPVDICSLIEDHGRGIFAALRILSTERMIRLIPFTGDLYTWMDEQGYTPGQEYRASGRVYTQIVRA